MANASNSATRGELQRRAGTRARREVRFQRRSTHLRSATASAFIDFDDFDEYEDISDAGSIRNLVTGTEALTITDAGTPTSPTRPPPPAPTLQSPTSPTPPSPLVPNLQSSTPAILSPVVIPRKPVVIPQSPTTTQVRPRPRSYVAQPTTPKKAQPTTPKKSRKNWIKRIIMAPISHTFQQTFMAGEQSHGTSDASDVLANCPPRLGEASPVREVPITPRAARTLGVSIPEGSEQPTVIDTAFTTGESDKQHEVQVELGGGEDESLASSAVNKRPTRKLSQYFNTRKTQVRGEFTDHVKSPTIADNASSSDIGRRFRNFNAFSTRSRNAPLMVPSISAPVLVSTTAPHLVHSASHIRAGPHNENPEEDRKKSGVSTPTPVQDDFHTESGYADYHDDEETEDQRIWNELEVDKQKLARMAEEREAMDAEVEQMRLEHEEFKIEFYRTMDLGGAIAVKPGMVKVIDI